MTKDKSAFSKQVNWPSAVNNALRILKEINPFYRDKIITNGKKLLKNQILPFGTCELIRVNDALKEK